MSQRAGVVWTALAVAMTAVAGLFFALDRSVAPRMDGVALPPLVASAGPTNVEAVLQTRVPLDQQRWDAIVIHHSGSPVGTPASIEAQHKALNYKGLGYHFVIGNGTGTADGELYVGYRWRDQLPGAHVVGPDADRLNQHAIGICLVGDGTRRPFTKSQFRRLVQTVRALSERLDIPPSRIYVHSDVAPVASPGKFFPEASFRAEIASGR